MEENQKQIDENVYKSIGSDKEITDPHVRIIISAFDGKKFSREDIDRFKQLEKTFAKFSQIENGDVILQNLTSDMKEKISREAQVQDGTVVIGQIASEAIIISEKTYSEYSKDQKSKKEKVETNVDRINKVKEKNREANQRREEEENPKEKLDKYEKKKKNYIDLMEKMGASKEEQKLLDKIFSDAMKPDGDIYANNVLKSLERLEKEKTKEALIEYQQKIIEFYESRVEQLTRRKKTEFKEKFIDAKGFKGRKAVKDSYSELKQTQLAEIDRQIEEYRLGAESARKKIEDIQAGKYDKMFEQLQAEQEEAKQYEEIVQRISEMEKNGQVKEQEYKELKERKRRILEAQKVESYETQLKSLREDLEKKLQKRKDGIDNSTEAAENDEAIKRIEGNIAILEVKKMHLAEAKNKAMQGKVIFSDEKNVGCEYDVTNLRKIRSDDTTKKETADYYLRFASRINGIYAAGGGDISYTEIQRSYLGVKKNLAGKKVDKAISAILGDYIENYKKYVSLFKTVEGRDQKNIIFKEILSSRVTFQRRLRELGLDEDYLHSILTQFYIPDDQIDPVDYQIMLREHGVYESKRKGLQNSVYAANAGNQIERLERNREIFKDIVRSINDNPDREEIGTQLMDVMRRVFTRNKDYDAFKEAESEEEIFAALKTSYDRFFKEDERYDENVESQFFDMVKEQYDKYGKDGLQTLYENSLVLNIYSSNFKNYLKKESIKKLYLYPLKEEEKVKFDTSSTEKGKKWPDFLNIEENAKYLDIMFAMRRDHIHETDIGNTLLQLDPEAFRNAYIFYELGANKKTLQDPELGDDRKAELRDKNKQLLSMLLKQYEKKCNKIQRELVDRARFVTDPEEHDKLIKKASEYSNAFMIAYTQLQDFDIENVEFDFPEGEKQKIPDQILESAMAIGNIETGEINVGTERKTEEIESVIYKGSVVGATLRESQESMESLPDAYIPSASAPMGSFVENALLGIDNIIEKTKSTNSEMIAEVFDEVKSITERERSDGAEPNKRQEEMDKKLDEENKKRKRRSRKIKGVNS